MGRSFNGGPILRSPSFGSAGLAEPHNPPNNTRIQDPESGSDGLAMEFGSEESYHDSPPQSKSEDEDGGEPEAAALGVNPNNYHGALGAPCTHSEFAAHKERFDVFQQVVEDDLLNLSSKLDKVEENFSALDYKLSAVITQVTTLEQENVSVVSNMKEMTGAANCNYNSFNSKLQDLQSSDFGAPD